MRVTKIGPPTPTYRKALGYDPDIPDGDVEEPEFEGAYVLIPRDDSGPMEFVPAPTVTDGDLDTYALTSEHDEAMHITMDFSIRLVSVFVLGAWETEGERTYTLEAGNIPDFSDAIELASATFTAPDAWEPYEIEFTYESLPTAYQYYRLIGPDEERRWHNIRLIQASVDGCECIELCRDSEPPSFVTGNDAGDLEQSDPIDLDAIPEPGDLWLTGGTAGSITDWTTIESAITPGTHVTFRLQAKEAEAGDDGEITTGGPTFWLTALFRGVSATVAASDILDDQSSGAGTISMPLTVPDGPHLVIGYFAHDNSNAFTPASGWEMAAESVPATTKPHGLVYKFSDGGTVESPGVVASAAGDWGGIVAAFPVSDQGEAIEGGPNATAGDGTKAAPCTHDHHYTAEQIEITPFGSIAADNVQDALEEIVAEASGGTPATTVESETTFGITPAVGTDTEYARQDHTHGSPANPLTGAALTALGLVGPLLIADDHSTPLVFEDILQTEEGDDFLYADIGA